MSSGSSSDNQTPVETSSSISGDLSCTSFISTGAAVVIIVNSVEPSDRSQYRPAASKFSSLVFLKKYGCFPSPTTFHSYHPDIGTRHLLFLNADINVFFSNSDSNLVLNNGLELL